MTDNCSTKTGHFTHYCRKDVEICIVTCVIYHFLVNNSVNCRHEKDVSFFVCCVTAAVATKIAPKILLSVVFKVFYVVIKLFKASRTPHNFYLKITALHYKKFEVLTHQVSL